MAAAQEQPIDSSPQPPGLAATPDLDLAFSADGELEPELLQAAGSWGDPLAGAELWHGRLSAWLAQLAAELPEELQAPAYSLGLSLVGDAEIASLNADWRAKEGPTDVLAFAAQDEGLEGAPPMPLPPQGEADDDDDSDDDDPEADDADDDELDGEHPGDDGWDGEPLELGDIVISLETAARQAPEHGHDLERELLFLASHGLLHLLGWDHPDDASLAAMLERQERLLAAG